VNVDLIYGLPLQTRAGFTRTIDEVVALRPDRIALFSFAYVPDAKPHQKKIDVSDLPSVDEKLAIFCDARRRLLDQGWVGIGIDHFALPHDPLARALEDGTLSRNFQGYCAGGAVDTIGFGMSAIGELGGVYAQNAKTLPAYDAAIDAGRLPTTRGVRLSPNDEARRFAIREVMCRFRVDFADVERRFGVRLDAATAVTVGANLERCEADGLAVVRARVLSVTPLGRLFTRIVAASLDAHLAQPHQNMALPYARVV
jgi:oxygen-independent coproporphyrinogen-3 oxidase